MLFLRPFARFSGERGGKVVGKRDKNAARTRFQIYKPFYREISERRLYNRQNLRRENQVFTASLIKFLQLYEIVVTFEKMSF